MVNIIILIIKIIGISALIANVLNSQPYLLLLNKLNQKLDPCNKKTWVFNFLKCPLCFGFWLSIIPAYLLSNNDIILFLAIIGIIPILAEFITRQLNQIKL